MKTDSTDAYVIKLWFGNYGTYLIPSQFHGIKFAKNGLPDRRYKRFGDFMRWVIAQENDSKNQIEASK